MKSRHLSIWSLSKHRHRPGTQTCNMQFRWWFDDSSWLKTCKVLSIRVVNCLQLLRTCTALLSGSNLIWRSASRLSASSMADLYTGSVNSPKSAWLHSWPRPLDTMTMRPPVEIKRVGPLSNDRWNPWEERRRHDATLRRLSTGRQERVYSRVCAWGKGSATVCRASKDVVSKMGHACNMVPEAGKYCCRYVS